MFKRFIINTIKLYQICFSPIKKPCCRFYPSCSQYAIDAVTKYGALKGILMAARRVLKCHPFHPGGYDPVK